MYELCMYWRALAQTRVCVCVYVCINTREHRLYVFMSVVSSVSLSVRRGECLSVCVCVHSCDVVVVAQLSPTPATTTTFERASSTHPLRVCVCESLPLPLPLLLSLSRRTLFAAIFTCLLSERSLPARSCCCCCLCLLSTSYSIVIACALCICCILKNCLHMPLLLLLLLPLLMAAQLSAKVHTQ